MQQTFQSGNHVPGQERDETKVQQADIARQQANAERAQKGEQQQGGAAGREGVASQNPAEFDTRSGHAGGVEPQADPKI